MANPDFHTVVQNLLEQLRGTWRFRWVALAVAWSLAIVLWIIVFLVPDTYQASARVFVNTKTTLSEATRGISLEDDVDNQIQRVRQALIGGPELQKVAEETDLLAGALTVRDKQEVLEKLRKAIDISGGISRENPSAGVFTITYKNYSRGKSLQVVDRLLNAFVEGALGGKRQGSEQAQQFLASQISDYKRRLSSAEESLAEFKKRNVGLMPGAQGDYFSRLQTEMDGLAKVQQTLNVVVRRRDEIKRQLHGERPFVAGSASSAPLSGSVALTGPGDAGATSDTAAHIRVTQARLDELLLRFTDKHPDVIALRQNLIDLQAREQAEIEAARRGDVGAADSLGLKANPVYQNMQLQYNQAEVDVAALQQDTAERQNKITSLRSMMNTAPEVEAEYAKLTRDYDVTQAEYHALLARLDRAKLGDEAQATGMVRFEVIDPPTAEFKPIAPNRPLLIGASAVLALAVGAGIAYLMHLLRPVFLSSRQLNAITGLPVIGEVSMTWLEKYHATHRRGTLLYATGTAALVVLATAVVLLQQRISDVVRGLLT